MLCQKATNPSKSTEYLAEFREKVGNPTGRPEYFRQSKPGVDPRRWGSAVRAGHRPGGGNLGHGVLVGWWQRLWGGGGPRRCGMGVLLGRWGNRAPGVLRGWLWGPGRGAHIAPDHPTADSGRGEQPAVMRRCVVGWAWPTHDPFGPQAVNLPDSSPSRTMARRAGHLRSFFGRATTHHTRTHNPRRFCRRSGAMSSITTPQACFVGQLRKTRPRPRALA